MDPNSLKTKWHKTTGGKILIVALTAIGVTGLVFLVKHYTKPKHVFKSETKPENKEQAEDNNNSFAEAELPNGGKDCSDIKTTFDKDFNYIKCKADWYIISKDIKVGKIKEWTSLSGNKTASELLNKRYYS